jgi:hypothetical protein
VMLRVWSIGGGALPVWRWAASERAGRQTMGRPFVSSFVFTTDRAA